MSGLTSRYRWYLRIRIFQLNRHTLLCFQTIAIQINNVKNAFGEVIVTRRRQLRNQQIQENGETFPICVSIRKNCTKGNRMYGKMP